jgi:hypothetical protein
MIMKQQIFVELKRKDLIGLYGGNNESESKWININGVLVEFFVNTKNNDSCSK